MLRYRIGRGLQVIGMIILPFGIASELMEKVGLGQSLLIAAAGMLVFYVGYIIQTSGKNADPELGQTSLEQRARLLNLSAWPMLTWSISDALSWSPTRRRALLVLNLPLQRDEALVSN